MNLRYQHLDQKRKKSKNGMGFKGDKSERFSVIHHIPQVLGECSISTSCKTCISRFCATWLVDLCQDEYNHLTLLSSVGM